MRLRQITIEGVYGRRFSINAGGKHLLLVGPEGAGKTSIVSGVTWALTGEWPDFPGRTDPIKSATLLKQILGAPRAQLTFADGTVIERDLEHETACVTNGAPARGAVALLGGNATAALAALAAAVPPSTSQLATIRAAETSDAVQERLAAVLTTFDRAPSLGALQEAQATIRRAVLDRQADVRRLANATRLAPVDGAAIEAARAHWEALVGQSAAQQALHAQAREKFDTWVAAAERLCQRERTAHEWIEAQQRRLAADEAEIRSARDALGTAPETEPDDSPVRTLERMLALTDALGGSCGWCARAIDLQQLDEARRTVQIAPILAAARARLARALVSERTNRATLEQWQAKLIEIQAAIVALGDPPAEPPTVDDVDVDAARMRYQALTMQHASYEAAAKQRREHDIAAQALAADKAVEAALRTMAAEALRATVQQITDAVSARLPPTYRLALDVDDGVTVALRKGDVTFRGFSGGEWALLCVALGAVLAPADGPAVLALPGDRDIRPELLRAWMPQFADCKHTVVLTSTKWTGKAPAGWLVVQLEGVAP